MTEKTESAVNTKELLTIMDYDDSFIKICFEEFLTNSLIMLEDIKRAINAKSPSMLYQTSHKLKGSLQYLAAYPAVKVAYELEIIGKNGSVDGAQALFCSLLKEVKRLKVFIAEY